MLRKKVSGFTLIELMVVIVIIGVLASLAIPRFTEASAKAKVAEAPRVLASFESAYLAARAELSKEDLAALTLGDLVFEVPGDSRWWTYQEVGDAPVTGLEGVAKSAMAKFPEGGLLATSYVEANDCFNHTGDAAGDKMVPNFIKGGCAD
ncbi:MAG: type II secretion system GspH family protein [Chitinispirillales bacterium]|jgi:prepilin-type N-terminal cleavage/methylation domain-containing protein|nr:type II secretion system GspH family protein [Chitinispirillales bacterium]